MSSRLDRLVSLLENGSSAAIRLTAAKQLAQLATKSSNAISFQFGDDTKQTVPQHAPQADYDALMAVVARILPCLRSKNFETRTAASTALANICTSIPVWSPGELSEPSASTSSLEPPPYPAVDLSHLMYTTKPLVASSGQEYVLPSSFASVHDVKKAKKEAMKRLGLEFLEGVDDAMDWEKELEADIPLRSPDQSTPRDDDVKSEPADSSIPSTSKYNPSAPPPSEYVPRDTPEPAPQGNMSARELNRLKRKRKGGNVTVMAVPPKQGADSKYNPVPSSEASPKVRLTGLKNSPSAPSTPASRSPPPQDKVVVDPSKGGQVDAQSKRISLLKAIAVSEGEWPWAGVIRLLELELFDPVWSTRHGAACAIRDILKPQGACGGMFTGRSAGQNKTNHERWSNELASRIICVLVLDRFCDFSNDQSISPVRETLAQTLASLFIHMPKRSLLSTHRILLDMARQDFSKEGTSKPYVWQVRHGGMLGLKYEVAVRRDLLVDGSMDDASETTLVNADHVNGHDVEMKSHDILKTVVACAILGLGDSDDDVRSVAASTLLPVTEELVKFLPEELPLLLVVLWDGLANMKDDLSSSVGAVMELLGKLVAFPEVIDIVASEDKSKPLTALAPILFSFFRHTIPNVRLQVVTTLHSFLQVSDLPKDWISHAFLCLVFQNLLVEERESIRSATLELWKTCLDILSLTENAMQATISSPLISDWFALMLQPWGVPLDTTLFYHHALHQQNNKDDKGERHNVDKAMLAQDVALVTAEVIWEARISATRAMGLLISAWPSAEEANTIFQEIILHYLTSSSALQRVLAATTIEEYAVLASSDSQEGEPDDLFESAHGLSSPLPQALAAHLLSILTQSSPVCYREAAPNLRRLSSECVGLINAFVADGKLDRSTIPHIPTEVDLTGTKLNYFTANIAEEVAGPIYKDLLARAYKLKKKEVTTIEAKQATIVASIVMYKGAQERHEVRALAAIASAIVALQAVPAKVGTVVKNLMNGVKFEESVVFQKRFAHALASMVDLGLSKLNASLPITKVVKNLCAFLCSDPIQTPAFDANVSKTAGVLSFKWKVEPVVPSASDSDEVLKARISRRGAEFALTELSLKFGDRLIDVVPMLWESTTDGLITSCGSGVTKDADNMMSKQTGQDVIDSLVTLQTVVPSLHGRLWSRVMGLLPSLSTALKSRYAIVRQATAKCLAVICSTMTLDGMRFVIEQVLPLLGDAKSVTNRQGAIEVIFNILETLDVKALPYVIFLVVPVLGRMSDTDDDIRSTATNTFASLVKMVPLETGLPDPEGFPKELLDRRDKEREFLTQLLDGSKVEEYKIPVKIEAELRKYQQDGVNWLAFLSKYQLHGVLCDDMGLGKTLQSICILASKHHERSIASEKTRSQESSHLPSLIVCPPTLTGHWFYEIQKYAKTLTPMLYTGGSRERVKLLSLIPQRDVVITSYEVVRNDVQNLSKFDWLYCILDEGHIIKNGKTKLTKSVKQLRAQHRLILSGTPIQNNVLELWSLFDFLMPGFLGTEQAFNERFSKPILANRDNKNNSKTSEAAALALESLHKQVLPFLLRRLKEDVLHDLPPKIIQDYYCELSDLQKQLYDEFSESQAFEQSRGEITNGKSEKGGQHVFQSLQYLKKLCNHPALVLKDGDEKTKKILAKFRSSSDCASPLRDIQHAPKLQALRQLLLDCGIGIAPTDDKKSLDLDVDADAAFSQHRVLIFCQMKQMLDMIETDLFKIHMPSVTYMRLDGSTDTNKRHAVVQTFNGDPSIDCLLLTTHVGGLGLTLTGADTVIFVEHDWNPMKDLQAMDRAHRIGQKKVVNVYRLITKDTLEEKIMGLQRFKLNIANSVINQQNSGLASMGTDLVLDLFKRTPQSDDPKKKEREGTGQKSILAGLEDLPTEEEYNDLDVSSFLSSK